MRVFWSHCVRHCAYLFRETMSKDREVGLQKGKFNSSKTLSLLAKDVIISKHYEIGRKISISTESTVNSKHNQHNNIPP